MRSIFISSALFVGLISAAPAQATQYKLDCIFGTKQTVAIAYIGDLPAFIEPDVDDIHCRKESEKGPDTFTLPGFPGEYRSPKAIEKAIGDIRSVLESGAMKDVAIEALPPAMSFVQKLMNEEAAAQKKKPQTK